MSNERDNLDKLLLVFVHGFRGSDTSFKDFPNRLQTILTNTVAADVNAVVYPSYKTSGDLRVAVDNFSRWLCSEVAILQQEIKRINSTGKVMIVLLGHSMGGIVSAETIIRFHDNQLLGAKIIGMIAYDTPFYSINQNFVADKAWSSVDQMNKEVGRFWNTRNSAAAVTAATATTKAITNGTSSRSVSNNSSGVKKWGLFAGVLGAAAIGAAAYMARDQISATVSEAFDQLTFVGDLTDMNGCEQRVKKLLQVPDIFFKCFYVQLSSIGSDHRPKTFIKLPPADIAYLFVPVNSNADNEINAHTSMFNPKKTDHYYELGSDSISLINEMVARFQRQKLDHAIDNNPHHPPPLSQSINPSNSVSPKIDSAETPIIITKPTSYPYYPPPNNTTSSSTVASASSIFPST